MQGYRTVYILMYAIFSIVFLVICVQRVLIADIIETPNWGYTFDDVETSVQYCNIVVLRELADLWSIVSAQILAVKKLSISSTRTNLNQQSPSTARNKPLIEVGSYRDLARA